MIECVKVCINVCVCLCAYGCMSVYVCVNVSNKKIMTIKIYFSILCLSQSGRSYDDLCRMKLCMTLKYLKQIDPCTGYHTLKGA